MIDREALLKALPLFSEFEPSALAELAAVLKPRGFREGEVIFEEGSSGQSMFIISSGEVAVEKTLASEGGSFKTLSVFGPGDFFGEMALASGERRTARALARAGTQLLELDKNAVSAFAEKYPAAVAGFFLAIVRALSGRLKKTTADLALLSDLSRISFSEWESEKKLLAKLVEETLLRLEGNWAAQAYIYDEYSDELEPASGGDSARAAGLKKITENVPNRWLEPNVYLAVLAGKKRPCGFIVFSSRSELSSRDRNEAEATFSTLGIIASAAAEKARRNKETTLRSRLESQRHKLM